MGRDTITWMSKGKRKRKLTERRTTQGLMGEGTKERRGTGRREKQRSGERKRFRLVARLHGMQVR